jgi:hypothetical protein
LFDNRSVPRTSSRLTVWLFAALLLAKGAVPFLASAAAQLHGKGVADICPIYGVALPAAPAVDPHAGHHHLPTRRTATMPPRRRRDARSDDVRCATTRAAATTAC